MGLWGVTAALAALLFGGIAWQIDWGEQQAEWNLTKAIAAQKKRATGDVNDAVDQLNHNALVRAKQKAAAENRPFSDDCVILGFRPAGNSDFEELLLAMEVNGNLTYVGSINKGIPDSARSYLAERMQQLLCRDPFIPLELSGVRWITPNLAIRVKYERLENQKRLIRPAFVKLLPEL
jgi:hypothetical protein